MTAKENKKSITIIKTLTIESADFSGVIKKKTLKMSNNILKTNYHSSNNQKIANRDAK